MTKLETYLRTNEVFTLEGLAQALHLRDAKAALDLLNYHRRLRRVKNVARGVYATVPIGLSAEEYLPDRYLVAAAIRTDAIFSHHAALELLGAAHSDWSVCTVVSERRHGRVSLGSVEIRFLRHPAALKREGLQALGTVPVTHTRRTLLVTGTERTLLDGFRQPGLVGGPEELVESAAGFGVLDLRLVSSLLEAYDERLLWAATGWFLESYSRRFFVLPRVLGLPGTSPPEITSVPCPQPARGGDAVALELDPA